MAKLPKPTTQYDGKYIKVLKRGKWEYVSRKKITGIVGIIPVTDDGKILLIEQFRVPVGKTVIELPAGLAGDVEGEENEPLVNAARRELLEETGYEAKQMVEVAAGTPSAGLCDEYVTLFLATGLKKTGKGEGDGSEQITTHKVSLAGAERWLAKRVKMGCLIDIKVYSGLYFARQK